MKAKILILAVLMSVSAVLVAQPKEQGPVRAFHGRNADVGMQRDKSPMNGLNLTDAQKEAFKKSMMALQKQLQPVRNELGEVEARQKSLTMVDKPDMAAINKNIEKMGSLKVEMAKIQTKHHLEMRAQLTDEQRLKFDAFKHRMKEGKGMKGPRGPRGPRGMK